MGIYEEMKKVEESKMDSIFCSFERINDETTSLHIEINADGLEILLLIFNLMDTISEKENISYDENMIRTMIEYKKYRVIKDD